VPVDRVRPNPHQPRHRFDAAQLAELAASIREHGVVMPIVVRRDSEGFVLVAGERRLRAARLAGLTDIPAVVRGADLAADAQLVLALLENLQRADLDPIEAAEGYQRLVQEFGLRQEDVARKVGKDRATVANSLRLLNLPPEGREAVIAGVITAGHARALLPLAEEPERFAQALRIVRERELNVRGTEALVRQLREPPAPAPRPDKGLERLGRELARAVGVKVRITARRGGGGRVLLDYGNDAELDAVVRRLRGD
jgi:ParB family chromosome partitioning protein